MQVDWLRTFVAVVDHGGFAAASEAIFRSQSRVSAHIAALEADLDAVLFDRRQRPVALTDYGRTFLGHARAILGRLDASREDLGALRGLRTGRVSLGSYPSVSAAFLPAVVKEFGRKFSGIDLDLVELSCEELDAHLADNRIALAIRPTMPPVCHDGIEHIVLWRETLHLVFPESHALARSTGPLSLSAVDSADIIAPATVVAPEQPYVGPRICRQVSFRTDYPQALISLVRAGLGVGLTNQLALQVSNQAGITVRRVSDHDASREVALFWNARSYRPAAADALYETILATPLPEGIVACPRLG